MSLIVGVFLERKKNIVSNQILPVTVTLNVSTFLLALISHDKIESLMVYLFFNETSYFTQSLYKVNKALLQKQVKIAFQLPTHTFLTGSWFKTSEAVYTLCLYFLFVKQLVM